MDIKAIAHSSKLEIKENEYKDIKSKLEKSMIEFEEIANFKDSKDIMISLSSNQNCYKDDIVGTSLNREKALKNSKRKDGDYISVPRVVE